MLLAGDIGATKTNLALFIAEGGEVQVIAEETFLNHGHAALDEIVAPFIARHGGPPEAACFGVAGPVADGRARMPNLDWPIEADHLVRTLGVERVILINDLEATAYGIATAAPEHLAVLNRGVPRAGANAALIAAGTGLGEAILYWDGSRHRVLASEGGHTDYAPRDAEQMAILGRLGERFGHVSCERVVSGRGLRNVYDVLDIEEAPALAGRIETAEDASAVITEAALAGASSRCVRALEVFVASYGAAAGNLALTALATGGVYVGGGIAPRILPKLTDGTFVRAFCDKGRFTDLLRTIPVKVILEPKTALRGAAAYLAGVKAEGRAS
jgi:glucokinase